MSYTYSYISDALSSGLLFGVFSGVPTTLIGIATYVLSALGLYTIAKRRGLNHPWLAWIPVASAWIVGSLSDQYRYVVNGENKSKRKVLLTLNIITTVLSLVMVACGIGMVAQALIGAAGGIDEEAMVQAVIGPLVGVLGLCLPLAGVAIAYAVIYYMALYHGLLVDASRSADQCLRHHSDSARDHHQAQHCGNDVQRQQNLPLGLILPVDHIAVLIGKRTHDPRAGHRNPGQPRVVQPPALGNGIKTQGA